MTDRKLIDLDPRVLTAHPSNVRRDVGDLDELTTSIRALGVLQRIVLAPLPDGGYRIIAGHRRAAAAIQAELNAVPCEVLSSLAGAEAEQVAAMLVENLQRRGLTATEEADGYAQLAAFDGWDVEAIAKTTGRKASRVRDGLAAVGLPTEARQALAEGELTLESAAAMAEFADDEPVMRRLLKNSRWGFEHALADERRRREHATIARQLRSELDADGVTVVKKPKDYPWGCLEAEASSLLDADGNELDPDEVKTQEGFAAFLTDGGYSPPSVVVICLDPEKSGYTRTSRTNYVSPQEAARRAERAAVETARLEALRAAAEVRWKFLLATFGHAKGAKEFRLEAERHLLLSGGIFRFDAEVEEQIRAVAGADRAGIAQAGEALLRRFVVAYWVVGFERQLRHMGRHGWCQDEPAALAWLDRLTALGYELSEAEAQLRADLVERIDPADDEADEANEANEGDEDDYEVGDDEVESDDGVETTEDEGDAASAISVDDSVDDGEGAGAPGTEPGSEPAPPTA